MKNKFFENEYIVTNGIGGFSSSSVSGANTRKYHSILNASLNPPVQRQILLSKVLTHIEEGNQHYILESTIAKDSTSDQTKLLTNYAYYPLPTFDYTLQYAQIQKTISMKYGENTAAVQYKITTQNNPIKIRCELLVNNRDHHDLSEKDSFSYRQSVINNTLKLDSESITWFIKGFGTYQTIDQWANPEYYPIENRRGQEDVDTNYIPGAFVVEIPAFSQITLGIVASTEEINENIEEIISREIRRRHSLSHEDQLIEKKLQIACDNFIVERKSTHSKTVIAGYPWFTDWGRDTMIALPGLTLATERYDDAKDIIKTFIKYEKDGLIPNMFPDNNIEPMYNTIDGTLWLFIAVYQYYIETQDNDFIKEIFPTLERIIDKHIHGTHYNIHVDSDGLLDGGDASTQLTWMDVKIDGHVVTPRHGKAVEINALWYNALNIMAYLSDTLNIKNTIAYLDYAEKCFESFNTYFWNDDKECLFDLIQDGQPVDRVRPNQIFAVSLPFGILDEEKEKSVVKIVEDELLTPNGLRSLSRDHKDYTSTYDGDVYKRDYAYHQGTVWGWLIGPYLQAHYNVYNDKNYIEEKLNLYLEHLDDTGLGGISEVFYGDAPHKARGCFTQAWSVSEAMRIYKLIQKNKES